ncbi:MAG: quinol:cytochrome C oxidoreductase [Phycisphaerae bacterium]|nr:quinol:cytochrome C oxidoreductase [Phycisphaerae bacterium]
MSHAIDTNLIMARDNIELSEGAGRGLSSVLIGVGAVGIAATILAAFSGDEAMATIAAHAYHTGVMAVIGFSVAAMGFVMILQQTNAGWSATIRRQFENIMSLIWVGGLLFIVDIAFQLLMNSARHVYIWDWMNAAHTAGDELYRHKSGYLNVPFFAARAIAYFIIWFVLARSLWEYSTRQDIDGDKWHTARARTLSAPGLLLFAFTSAFAAFDWMMTLDYHWFSTMFGVYFFAGSMVSMLALGALILITLRAFGRLHGAFTDEHLHDLGKLIFAFTVFWAYISFSQYFLIWYANIPEETAWMLRRKIGSWEWLSWLLPIGHFIIPFILLLPRPMRRSRKAVALVSLWLIVMHLFDLYWAIRPEAKIEGQDTILGPSPIDVIAVVAPVLVFIGFLIRKVGSGPLIPLKDPRLPEGLAHKNYV